jgi:hypothetical protein
MFLQARSGISRSGICFALFLGGLGRVITLTPSFQSQIFEFAAVAAATGLISPNRSEWLLALALTIGLACMV